MNKISILIMALVLSMAPKTTVKAAGWSVQSSTAIADLDPQSVISLQLADTKQKPAILGYALGTVAVDLQQVETRYTPSTLQDIAKDLVAKQFGANQFAAFDAIVRHESNWNPNAVNRSSGACGLPQALPCSKIADRSPAGQLSWMVNYIKDRYGTPANAWSFWHNHNWY